MTTKELITKAILNASDEKPVEFKQNIESAVSAKLKAGLSNTIKTVEQNMFNRKK
jgi:hypothetical protein